MLLLAGLAILGPGSSREAPPSLAVLFASFVGRNQSPAFIEGGQYGNRKERRSSVHRRARGNIGDHGFEPLSSLGKLKLPRELRRNAHQGLDTSLQAPPSGRPDDGLRHHEGRGSVAQ